MHMHILMYIHIFHRGFLRSPERSFDVLTPRTFARKISDHVQTESGRFMPTFPPGKIYHLKVTKNTKPWYVHMIVELYIHVHVA